MPRKALWLQGLTNPESVPPELAYVAVAERFGCDPQAVLEWDEEVAEDVALFLRISNANSRAAAQVRRGLRG